jgi:hypothetical protein
VDRLPVFEKDDPKIALFLWDECPALDTTVALNLFRYGMTDGELDPCVADANPISATSSVLKVVSRLQSTVRVAPHIRKSRENPVRIIPKFRTSTRAA